MKRGKESLIHGTVHEFVKRDNVIKNKHTSFWIELLSKEGIIGTIKQKQEKIRKEKHQVIFHQ